jgi:hypothetical protein
VNAWNGGKEFSNNETECFEIFSGTRIEFSVNLRAYSDEED